MTPDPFAPLIDSIAARVAAAMADRAPPIDIDALASAVADRIDSTAVPSALWSTDRVAAFLDVSPRTVRDLARQPHFPAPISVGGQKRWRGADIISWADRQQAERKAA